VIIRQHQITALSDGIVVATQRYDDISTAIATSLLSRALPSTGAPKLPSSGTSTCLATGRSVAV
jgi:hypothetical protein